MRTSEQINELAAALSKAQGQMGSADMDSTNPHFKSKFASLLAVVAAAKKPLSDNGLCVVQPVESNDSGHEVTTRLMHSSGQWLEATMKLSLRATDMQSLGSAVSYAKRYALAAMLGIVADEDDDGNAASTPTKQNTYSKPTQSTAKPPIRNDAPATEAQVKKLFAMSKERMVSQDVLRATLKSVYAVESTKDLRRWQMDELYEVFAKPDCSEAMLLSEIARADKARDGGA